jgi:hypothetical protein
VHGPQGNARSGSIGVPKRPRWLEVINDGLAVRAVNDHSRHPPGDIQTILWRGPGQGLGEDFTDSGQSPLQLLNRVGAGGWELANREDREDRGDGSSYWDPSTAVTIYTFKNLVRG